MAERQAEQRQGQAREAARQRRDAAPRRAGHHAALATQYQACAAKEPFRVSLCDSFHSLKTPLVSHSARYRCGEST